MMDPRCGLAGQDSFRLDSRYLGVAPDTPSGFLLFLFRELGLKQRRR